VTLAPSLLEQRLTLRGQLRNQRQEVAEQLFESKGGGRFPRSITMRVFIDQPALAGRLVTLIAGARFAGSVSALLIVVQMLRAARTRS
jgi:hypothetical protein